MKNPNPDKPDGRWTRDRIKAYLVQRFHTRAHMSLILASSGLAAMLGNWAMLRGGVHAMWLRYPIAVTLAYLTFLAGVWLWLRFMGMTQPSGKASSLADNADLPGGSFGGGGWGGGSSGRVAEAPFKGGGGGASGGGASDSWDEGDAAHLAAGAQANSGGASSGWSSLKGGGGGGGGGGGIDLDGDAIVLLLLSALLIGSIFFVSGYIVWMAPDILSEAAFGAALAGGLTKQAQAHGSEGWAEAVMKKTWWPFAIVLVASLAFALFAAKHYPEAQTLGQAVSMALRH